MKWYNEEKRKVSFIAITVGVKNIRGNVKEACHHPAICDVFEYPEHVVEGCEYRRANNIQ
jgi:hypothetical protein